MALITKYPRIAAICGLMAVAIGCALVAGAVVTFALSQLRAPVLGVALASRLTADYSEKSASEIAPIDPSVTLSVARDEQPAVAVTGKVTFAPIFETATGSQLPGATPSLVPGAAPATPGQPSTEAGASATPVPRSTPTPPAGGEPATSTPPPNGGTPVATSTPPPQEGDPRPTPTPLPQATPTTAPQATPTPPGQGGGPQATHTPPGQGGGPQATRTPNGQGGGPQATNTPNGPKPTHTPKP